MTAVNGDGENDDTEYTTETFLQKTMIGEHDPEAEGLKALRFLDVYFLRLDTDKSRAIELDEWQKHYLKFAAQQPNAAPKAANNDYYGR